MICAGIPTSWSKLVIRFSISFSVAFPSTFDNGIELSVLKQSFKLLVDKGLIKNISPPRVETEFKILSFTIALTVTIWFIIKSLFSFKRFNKLNPSKRGIIKSVNKISILPSARIFWNASSPLEAVSITYILDCIDTTEEINETTSGLSSTMKTLNFSI